jgi:hypothetical protein
MRLKRWVGDAAAAGAAAYYEAEAAAAHGAANGVGLADDDAAASTPFEEFFVEGKRVRVACGDAPNYHWNGAHSLVRLRLQLPTRLACTWAMTTATCTR